MLAVSTPNKIPMIKAKLQMKKPILEPKKKLSMPQSKSYRILNIKKSNLLSDEVLK